MTTPIPVPGEIDLLVANNGSTVDTSPKVIVEISFPLPIGATLVLLRDGLALAAAPVQTAPLVFEFVDNVVPGTYVYTAEVRQAARMEDSNAYTITVEPVNQGWSALVNQDGPYAIGNSGTESNMDDFNWHDSFWLAVVGNVKPTDVVMWQTVWTPGSDGNLPPLIVQHDSTLTQPFRLELQARLGSKGSVSYSSGVMLITLVVNGIIRGDVLELTLQDDQTDTVAEGASWRVWAPAVAPASIHFSKEYVQGSVVDDSAGVAWYDFTLTERRSVILSTIGSADTNGNSLDTEIALFDSAGNVITTDDESGGNGTSLISATLVAGTYYVAVAMYQLTVGPGWSAVSDTPGPNPGLVINFEVVQQIDATYTFTAGAYGSGAQAPAGSGIFVHTITNTSGIPLAIDLVGVAKTTVENSAPGTDYTLTPVWSRMLGGSILSYEFWENGVMTSTRPWDPYDTTEQTALPVALSTFLYNGNYPGSQRFVRFNLGVDGYAEVVTIFNESWTGGAFDSVWTGHMYARRPADLSSATVDLPIDVPGSPLIVQSPFSYLTWDYSSSANSNIRTNSDLPALYGTPTPGVSRYFLRDGSPITASATLQVVANPNTMLQPGDIVVVQGVMHVGTLTGNVDSQSYDGNSFTPLVREVSTRVSGAGDTVLQSYAEQGTDWQGLRGLCNYPLNVDARAFTVKATPVIGANGFCDFWYGPFFTLSLAELAAMPNGTLLTSTVNGIAVYRGGSVAPENLIFSDVNREIFTMKTEVRENPNFQLVQNFSASPLAGTAPLTVVYQDLSNFPTTDVSYTVVGPQLNATTDTIAMQGVYDVIQEVRRPDTTMTQVTKTGYLTVNERAYPSDAPYVDIFRDEYNGAVIDIASHTPDLAPSGAVVTGTNVFTTGNGYAHRQDANPMQLRVDVARSTNTNFDYKLAWTMAFAQEVFTNGTLFFAHIFGNDYDGMNNGNPGYAAIRVFRQAGAVRLGLTLGNLGGDNYAELTTALPSSMGTIYDCELILTPAGGTFKINGETLNNVFDSSTWGNSLTAFQVTNVVNAIYLNRMRMAYKPVLSVVIQEDFNGAAGTFVPRAPTLPASGWLTDHAAPSATWPSMVLDGAGALVTPFVNSNFYNGGVDITKQVDVVDPVNGDLTYGIPTQISSIEFDISTSTAFRTGGTVGTYVFAMYLRFAAEDGGWEDYLSLSAYRDQTTGQAMWEYQNDYGGNYDTQTLPLVFAANTDYAFVITKVGANLEIRVNGNLIWTVPFVQSSQPLVNANLRHHSGKIRAFKVSGLG